MSDFHFTVQLLQNSPKISNRCRYTTQQSNDRSDYCDMTYMFEYPQFVKISLPENKLYPQYGLYAYSEGRATEKTRKMWFDGLPVLFLPGNSGSYMQVRSLASVALRKALADDYSYHFDYFTVNYNEELSGLYGGVLEGQTKYASLCIAKILSLYKNNKSIPKSVILIGHSMGGVIAKRLLTYEDTVYHTKIAITLAAPLHAPVVNADIALNNYYLSMASEWYNSNQKDDKVLISFGNGPRDVLIPSSLIYSSDCSINVLTTSVPAVWLSPDHVSIVWCKQLVLAINRFLFSIIDRKNNQLLGDYNINLIAQRYFKANRSMTINNDIIRPNATMLADAFWYEDNRRIYQISRPEVDKTTYLMIRLVSYPQNRFVAITATDLDDKDWIFGCNAKFVYNVHRYCKQATSLTDLSRWTGAVNGFGKRKMAAIHLSSIQKQYDWTHVVVKISPTRKPVTLNVDINDYNSRVINVDLGLKYYLKEVVIKEATEEHSVYYELNIKGFHSVHQALLLYVEPVSCKSNQYHASAEVHVPWAENHEYFHYFTHLKSSPMKLRLFKSNPNVTFGLDVTEPVKITFLLDPQCSYTMRLTVSWYYSFAQFARNYSPVLISYLAALMLLAVRNNILNYNEHNTILFLQGALAKDGIKQYYILVWQKIITYIIGSVPVLSFLTENANTNNIELQYFLRSWLTIPAYFIASGILNIATIALAAVMIFSSQLFYKLMFRALWRGWGWGGEWSERVCAGLQRAPALLSAMLLCAAPACGAASLLAQTLLYAFKVSKMYEEYLEDYVYKLLAKAASIICKIFYLNKVNSTSPTSNKLLPIQSSKNELISKDGSQHNYQTSESSFKVVKSIDKTKESPKQDPAETKVEDFTISKNTTVNEEKKTKLNESNEELENNLKASDVDEDLNNLNFHMMLLVMWIIVILVNGPALLTWAKNFTYCMVLKPDTSFIPGVLMTASSIYLWQLEFLRPKLKHYKSVSTGLYMMAVCFLVFGPLQLYIVSYGISTVFVLIVIQQLFDTENIEFTINHNVGDNSNNDYGSPHNLDDDSINNKEKNNENANCNVCNESRIYKMFKTLRDKFITTQEL